MSKVITKELIDRLYETVKNYKDTGQYNSIFKEISPHFQYENYHSDILRYYLEYDEVKKEFINYLNMKNENINFSEYNDGSVKREVSGKKTNRRIDIVLYSSEKNKAIIIENKSNDAPDQPRQLYSYFKILRKREVNVEAIFYLNKNKEKQPNFGDLFKGEEEKIKHLIIPSTLDDFNKNVIDKVININHGIINTNEDENLHRVKLLALSHEIKNLFNSIIYGEINMKDQEKLIKEMLEINDPNILEKLYNIYKAYINLPIYFRDKYKNYLLNKFKGIISDKNNEKRNNILIIKEYDSRDGEILSLYLNIKKNKLKYAIEIDFYVNAIICELWIRDNKKNQENDLNILKNKISVEYPFIPKTKCRHYGYAIEIKNILDDEKVKKTLDKVIEYGIAINELKD